MSRNIKSSQLEQIVIDYFNQRTDTSVRYDATGVYNVELRSEVAREHFGSGRVNLRLTFDRESFAINTDAELITVDHPFLEVIRNDLGRHEHITPRLAEGQVALQLLHHAGFTIPEITLETGSATPKIRVHQTYVPNIVLTYLVVYESDERIENIVRLCYDATDGSLQQESIIQLSQMLISDGAPDGVEPGLSQPLSLILDRGRQELEKRIAQDIKEFGSHIEEQMARDKASLKMHYEAELEEIKTKEKQVLHREARRDIKEQLDKNLQELEQKYTCHVKIQLLSILKIWWTLAHYDLTVNGRQKNVSVPGIVYDSRIGRSRFQTCPRCGNHTHFQVCIVGEHVECGADCSRGFDLMECASCHETMCHEHGHRCRVGGETLCNVPLTEPCSHNCQHCGQATCKTHGRETVEEKWVCEDHGRDASCCGKFYATSRLATCSVNPSELLCPDSTHRFHCADCRQAVCKAHSWTLREHRQQRVCDRHRKTCMSCDSSWSYLAQDLKQCITCGQLHCSEHIKMCVVCQQPVCVNDSKMTATGEILCGEHAGVCVFCSDSANIHIYTSLAPCVQCGEPSCSAHRKECDVCQHTYLCLKHHTKAHRCESCGRAACMQGLCGILEHTCRACGMTYCRHCVKGQALCLTCMTIERQPFETASEEMVSYLQGVRATLSNENAKALDKIIEAAPHISLKLSHNRTYHTFVYRARPPLLQRFFQGRINQQVRFVVHQNGQVVRIVNEPVTE